MCVYKSKLSLSNQSRKTPMRGRGCSAGASEDFYKADSKECEVTCGVACCTSSAAKLTPSPAPNPPGRGLRAEGCCCLDLWWIACVVMQLITSHLLVFFLEMWAYMAISVLRECHKARAPHTCRNGETMLCSSSRGMSLKKKERKKVVKFDFDNCFSCVQDFYDLVPQLRGS